MAPSDFPDGKFRFFPTMVPLVWRGRGSRGGEGPPLLQHTAIPIHPWQAPPQGNMLGLPLRVHHVLAVSNTMNTPRLLQQAAPADYRLVTPRARVNRVTTPGAPTKKNRAKPPCAACAAPPPPPRPLRAPRACQTRRPLCAA